MAGKIIADTIETGAGADIPTSYVVNGSAKAWIDIPSGQASINASFNVSSLDDDGVGDGGVNFTSSMTSSLYAWTSGTDDNNRTTNMLTADITRGTKSSSSYDFNSVEINATVNRTDSDFDNFHIIMGDLA